MGQPWPLICLFLSFSQHNDKYSTQFDYKWKKLTLSAWDSNPGWWMVGYGSKAASKHTKFFLGMVLKRNTRDLSRAVLALENKWI